MIMKYFGSSGIRGLWNEKITPQLTMKVGNAISVSYNKVIIGTDFRVTSDVVVSALISGLLSGGADVYSAGYVSTSTLAYATKDYDCGVMITASHNPPEYNGIKLWNPDGLAFTTPQMENIEKRIDDKESKRVKWNEINSFHKIDIIKSHMDAIKKEIDIKDVDVIIDCGNGAASTISPLLFREMGASVTSINSNPDGYFSGRLSEPSEDNLQDLIGLVRKKGAAVGIAHDGDGDRFVAVTSEGRYLGGDMILAIFIKYFGFKEVVVPVDTSMLIDKLTEKVHRCKVGDVYVGEMMKNEGVEFGGEPSGTQIFSLFRYTPDAVYAAAKMLQIASNTNLEEMISSFPKYITKRKNIRYEERDKENIIKKLNDFAETQENVTKIDGIRIGYNDGWVLVRFSGTEPLIRITVEGEDEKVVDDYLNKIVEVLI